MMMTMMIMIMTISITGYEQIVGIVLLQSTQFHVAPKPYLPKTPNTGALIICNIIRTRLGGGGLYYTII